MVSYRGMKQLAEWAMGTWVRVGGDGGGARAACGPEGSERSTMITAIKDCQDRKCSRPVAGMQDGLGWVPLASLPDLVPCTRA